MFSPKSDSPGAYKREKNPSKLRLAAVASPFGQTRGVARDVVDRKRLAPLCLLASCLRNAVDTILEGVGYHPRSRSIAPSHLQRAPKPSVATVSGGCTIVVTVKGLKNQRENFVGTPPILEVSFDIR